MITKTQGFLASNGMLYTSLDDAQIVEIRSLLDDLDGSAGVSPDDLDRMARDMVANAAKLTAILCEADATGASPKKSKAPAPRKTLVSVLAALRAHYGGDDADAKILGAFRSGEIKSIKGIGEKSLEVLKVWAASFAEAPASVDFRKEQA